MSDSTTALIDFIINEAKIIQNIPSPTFQENQRAEYVKNRMNTLSGITPKIDEVGNVSVTFCNKKSNANGLLISAHLDTVFSKDQDLSLSETSNILAGPGIGDNSLGVAMLLGIAKYFSSKHNEFNRPITLLANVCEEGLGDLKGMKHYINTNRSDIESCIILEGFGLGSIIHRGLGVKRLRITATTQGGHPWGNADRPSAIHCIADLTNNLYKIKLSKKHRSSMNVGIIQGGQTINTIASQAHIDVDIRSTDPETLDQLLSKIENLCTKIEAQYKVSIEIAIIGDRPAGALHSSHKLVQNAILVYQENNIESKLNIASTDANIPLSLGIPAICIGITKGEHAHTMDERIYLDRLPIGVKSVFSIIESII